MAEAVTLRVEKSLMERVDGYAKSKEMKRSEAIRSLIDLGLKVNDIRGDEASKIDDEFQQMLIEIFIRENQQYSLSFKELPATEIQSNVKKVKAKLKEKFPLIAEKYKDFIFPDESAS